jgi:Arc/MetJ-type ribon-helix-helix transcriptional regulator
MAVTTKVTYSLKPQTVERVQELAVQWGVPRSEVVRRAIDKLVIEEINPRKQETPLDVFLRMQKSDGISPEVAAKFNAEVRRERRASGTKRG